MRDANTSSKVVWQYLRYCSLLQTNVAFEKPPPNFAVLELTIGHGIRELEDEVGLLCLYVTLVA